MSQRPALRPWASQHILLILPLGRSHTRDQGSHSPAFPPNSPSLPPPSWANSGHPPGPPGGWVSPWQSSRLKGGRPAQLNSQRTAGPPQTCGPRLPDSTGGSSDLPTPAPALPSQPWGWLGLGRGPGTCPLDRQQCPPRTEGSCLLGMSPGDREKAPVPRRSVSWVSKISLRRNSMIAMGPHHVTLTLTCHVSMETVSMETRGQPATGGGELGALSGPRALFRTGLSTWWRSHRAACGLGKERGEAHTAGQSGGPTCQGTRGDASPRSQRRPPRRTAFHLEQTEVLPSSGEH